MSRNELSRRTVLTGAAAVPIAAVPAAVATPPSRSKRRSLRCGLSGSAWPPSRQT
jgi:hypothetical protein